jgi:serine/threonine protein kinase
MQMARALTRAHAAGIVHRDLKPDNVFLVRNEDEEVAKILDFGIAKSDVHRVGAATATGTVMGTAYYMSPEQISGSKEVDHRTDLWAVGVITHECITGAKPFDSETLGGMVLKICTEPIRTPSVFGGVPAGFDQWFERSVMRDPAKRFQSAREMADELKRVCETGQVVGSPASASELANSKTQWLETGRVGLSQQSEVRTMSVPTRADTGGPLSRTASGASPSVALPTRSVWPWVLGTGALLSVAGAAIAFAIISPKLDPEAETAGTAGVAATAPDPSSLASSQLASVAPSVKVAERAQVDAGSPEGKSVPTVALASNEAPVTQPPPRSGGARRETRPPPPATPPTPPRDDAPSKKAKSPFDGLLKSRK